ncbi:MAG: ATP-binding protein [Dehalococcoidia bacterium]
MSPRVVLLLLLPLILGVGAALTGWVSLQAASNQAARTFAARRLEVARQVVTARERELDVVAAGFADLDGMFDFAVTRNAEFARSQLSEQRLRSMGVDQVVVTDLRGSVLAARAVPNAADPGGTRSVIANPGDAITGVVERGGVTGWTLTPDGPLLVAARAIRPSSGGQVARGVVLVARVLGTERRAALDREFDGRLTFLPLSAAQSDNATDGTVRIDGWDAVAGYSSLRDEAGRPSAMLRVEPDAADERVAAELARNAMLITVAVVSVASSGGAWLLFIVWVRRVQRMRADVLAMDNDVEAPLDRLGDAGEDAIGDLGGALAQVLGKMQEDSRLQVQAAREATAGERFGEAIVRGMGEGVVLLRTDGVCAVCNAAAAAALGVEAREVVGDRTAMQRELGDEVLGQLAVLASGQSARPRPVEIERDGRVLSLTAEEFTRDREAPGLLIRIRDITAIVEAEGLRRDLVSIVSHDLRTPLTVIASTIELLRGTRASAASPEDARMLEMMDRNVERMQDLIGDLLDSAALDAGQMQFDFDTLDLGMLAREMAELHRPQADAKRMALWVEVPPQPLWVHADRRRVRQVLANLLGNAVKYSDDGAQVWLRVIASASEVRVEVINTGHPIAPADQARIFEKFYRGAHSRQTSRGTGLGLAISRQIAAAHGGRLWLERSDAASSVFVLTLPLEGAAQPVETQG